MVFKSKAEGQELLRLLEEAHGLIPAERVKFVLWARNLCTPKEGPQGDLQHDVLYLDLLSVLPAQERWMSYLANARYNQVEAKLLTLFPDRVSLAYGEKFSHQHLQQAVVTLVVLHCRLELFGETAEAAEAA